MSIEQTLQDELRYALDRAYQTTVNFKLHLEAAVSSLPVHGERRILDIWAVVTRYGEAAINAKELVRLIDKFVLPIVLGEHADTNHLPDLAARLEWIIKHCDENLRTLVGEAVKLHEKKDTRFVHAIESGVLHASMIANHTVRSTVNRALANLRSIPAAQPADPTRRPVTPRQPGAQCPEPQTDKPT